MRHGWYLPVGVLALLGGPLLAASTAAAAATGTAPGAPPAAVQPGGPQVGPGGLVQHLAGSAGVRQAASANWSGYMVAGGTYKSVSASWTEPKGHCTAGGGHDYSSFWVGSGRNQR